MTTPTAICWSGGKDCSLALSRVRGDRDVRALVTTVTQAFDRVSMHGVRGELLRRQAQSLGVPLVEVAIPYPCSNDAYEAAMRTGLLELAASGVRDIVCGDLFLQDVRRYRDERLFAPTGCRGVYPLWQIPTNELTREFIDAGFRAVLCCVDTTVLPAEFAGREFDRDLLRELPKGIDPCGENGEFHTFVFDGPLFAKRVAWTAGVRELREERFQYVDLVPQFTPEG